MFLYIPSWVRRAWCVALWRSLCVRLRVHIGVPPVHARGSCGCTCVQSVRAVCVSTEILS